MTRTRRALLPPMAWSALLLIVIYLVGAIFIDGFASMRSVRAILLLGTFLGIAAAGETVVVVSGGIDLSVPFVIGAANVAVAQLYGNGLDFWAAVAIVVALAGLLGVVHGVVSASFGVHPLLITFGSGTALLGAVQWWTGGLPSGSAPDWLSRFVSISSTLGPLPFAPVVAAWAVLAAGMILLLRRTVLGWKAYGLGANAVAARLTMISQIKVWSFAFGLSAALSAVTGILYLGFTGSAFAQVGSPYLFLAIAAVVVGGTPIVGGGGGYVGTIVGALVLTTLDLVFTGFGVSGAFKQMLLGLILLALLAVYGREQRISDRI